MERLDKLLAATGRWSRKEAKVLVKSGRILVNGQRPGGPEDKVAPEDTVTLDGHPLITERYTYLMLHKPPGVVSSTQDPRDPTVLTLLPSRLQKLDLFPVGRLDKDAEGLLLLTNDGPLAHRLLSPRRHVDKTYFVRAGGPFTPADQAAFAAGMVLEDGLKCLPARLELLERRTEALVTLQEGKFHQIKRMTAACGKQVVYLKRLTMGPLRLDPALPPGGWRPLSEIELQALKILGPADAAPGG